MAALDNQIDVDSEKMMRAVTRATNLHIKRSELARARDSRDWTEGPRVDAAKPHRGARAAVRMALAKGTIEAPEDMPSIVCMSNRGKGLRRKPAIASIVHPGKTCSTNSSSEGDTTADEDSDRPQELSEVTSPEESPALGPQDAVHDFAGELDSWPALAATAKAVAADGSSTGETKPSHCEMALRFADVCLEGEAVTKGLRAKKRQAARLAREANRWKLCHSRRQLRLQVARKGQQAQATVDTEVAQEHKTEVSIAPTLSTTDIHSDQEMTKQVRASTRATNLHIKRSERSRARDARDWKWGRGVDGAKPHRGARALVRTRLAKGMLEAQEDMPGIVCMSQTSKGPRRKPALSRMVHSARSNGVCDDDDSDVSHEFETDELTTPGKGCTLEIRQESLAGNDQETVQELASELSGTWEALEVPAQPAPAQPAPAQPAPAQPASKGDKCVIC